MFIDPASREFIYEDERDPASNCIVIRAKMDVATANKVKGAMVAFSGDGAGAFDLGANLTALLVHNILDWRGPAFDGVPCTPANIMRLDPTEPLIERVVNEIGARNKPKASPLKNDRGASGSENAGAVASKANGVVASGKAH